MKSRKRSRDREDIRKDFQEAIARLRNGRPKNAKNRIALEQGKLRINPVTVSREAGRARGLIATADCPYPDIRALIVGTIKEPTSPKTAGDTIANLRADVKEARRLLRLAQAEVLVHFRARRRAELEATRWRKALDRVRQRSAEQAKIVTLVQPD